MSEAVKIPVRMSVDEFLAWEPGDGRAWQLVDGEPQAMAPASIPHGILQLELGGLLRNHFNAQGSPCVVVGAPGVTPHMQASHNMRVPDLAVTCSPSDLEGTSMAEPVLIIEILSPNNQRETWANVWTYATIPSVQEILVLNSFRLGAELLRRNPDGSWPQDSLAVISGDLVLDSVGFRVPLADIYRNTRLRPPAK